MRASTLARFLGAAALVLALAAPARADLRISELEVFLNDHEVTVHVVLLGALPDGVREGQ
jgi:cytochrome c-type biogenesis protein CcmE